jgi:uncharacterized Zn finger protein
LSGDGGRHRFILCSSLFGEDMEETQKMTNKQFKEYSRVAIQEAIVNLEGTILKIAEEATRREMLHDVEQISIMILQETMNATVKITRDINTVVTEAYNMCELMDKMPKDVQMKINKMMRDITNKIEEGMNKKTKKESEDTFKTKPK